jgi:hypothetical protein
MSRSPSRTALLTAATIALPVIVLVLLELFLRAVGFGHGLEPLFIAAPGRADYRQANPDVVKRFFANPADAPRLSIETSYFKAQKPAGSFRIVVQGASSAAGFPYGLGASIAGMVEQRLERSYPEREIEVISTAMAAVTSYALVDFAPEIVAEHPDAVLVYVGHNEYLGILGVGSTLRFASRPWITRLVMAARESRLFQLLRALTPSRAPPGRVLTADDTLMATVAGERSIPFDSGLYRRGLEQYRYNLTRLLSIYARAGIPVYIATVASNERDHPPFAGDDARAEFEVARRHESAQRFLEARHHYQVARDLDELRFRAPSAFNDIVRTVAARSGATVVDTETLLATRSPHGIIGADLMLEHVHPNLEGYFWLADGFYAALIQSPQLGRPDVRIDDATARAEIPVSAIDRWLGSYKMMRIRNGWPFRERSIETVLPEPGSAAERLAQQLYREEINWPQAQDALRLRA